MQRASWLGFGTERTSGFPVRVPFGPEDQQTLKSLRYVDNAYILMDLRFGLLGVLCLLALLASVIADFLIAWRDPANSGELLCAGLASGVFALMLALLTVWLPHDFCALFLWTAGVGSGLRAAPAVTHRTRSSRRPSHRGTLTKE